jgi:integrin alpha FG-GAP repeat containing protein 1
MTLSIIEPEAIKLPPAQNSLPIVLDINGDMKTDLLGYSKDTNELSVWKNVALSDSNNTNALFNL